MTSCISFLRERYQKPSSNNLFIKVCQEASTRINHTTKKKPMIWQWCVPSVAYIYSMRTQSHNTKKKPQVGLFYNTQNKLTAQQRQGRYLVRSFPQIPRTVWLWWDPVFGFWNQIYVWIRNWSFSRWRRNWNAKTGIEVNYGKLESIGLIFFFFFFFKSFSLLHVLAGSECTHSRVNESEQRGKWQNRRKFTSDCSPRIRIILIGLW